MPRIILVGPEAANIAKAWAPSIPDTIEVICTNDRGVAYYRAQNDTLFVLADETNAPYLHTTIISSLQALSEADLHAMTHPLIPIFGYKREKFEAGGEKERHRYELDEEQWLCLEEVLSCALTYDTVLERAVKYRTVPVLKSSMLVDGEREALVVAAAKTLNFDVLAFSGLELESAVTSLFEPYRTLWRWSDSQLRGFVSTVHSLYRESPYHSWFHAVDVVQFMSLVLSLPPMQYLFSPLEIATALVAGLFHDVDHDGVTNKGHMALSSDRHKFSARATQEQHHLAVTKHLLAYTRIDTMLLTSLITKMIDATDMASHGAYCKLITEKIGGSHAPLAAPASEQPLASPMGHTTPVSHSQMPHAQTTPHTAAHTQNYERYAREEEKHLLLIAIMKAADLSNTVRNMETARKWGQLLGKEFSLAFLREQKAHIPAASQSFHGDPLPAHDKVQLSFFKNVITPFYELLAQCEILNGFMAPLVTNAKLGVQHFEDVVAADTSSNNPTHDNEV